MPGSIQVLYGGPSGNSVYQKEWLVSPVTGKANPESFHWELSRVHCQIRFPIWLMAIVCSAIAAVPWIRWRFSLRFMLIATTLVAVVLARIVWLR
jgi:hypothetical protein